MEQSFSTKCKPKVARELSWLFPVMFFDGIEEASQCHTKSNIYQTDLSIILKLRATIKIISYPHNVHMVGWYQLSYFIWFKISCNCMYCAAKIINEFFICFKNIISMPSISPHRRWICKIKVSFSNSCNSIPISVSPMYQSLFISKSKALIAQGRNLCGLESFLPVRFVLAVDEVFDSICFAILWIFWTNKCGKYFNLSLSTSNENLQLTISNTFFLWYKFDVKIFCKS